MCVVMTFKIYCVLLYFGRCSAEICKSPPMWKSTKLFCVCIARYACVCVCLCVRVCVHACVRACVCRRAGTGGGEGHERYISSRLDLSFSRSAR